MLLLCHYVALLLFLAPCGQTVTFFVLLLSSNGLVPVAAFLFVGECPADGAGVATGARGEKCSEGGTSYMINHRPGAGRPALRCRAQITRDTPTASGGGGIDTRSAAVCAVVSAAAWKAWYLYTSAALLLTIQSHS